MTGLLVTGGAGFIGHHLCHHLVAQGHQVRVLDDLSSGSRAALPDGVALIQADICDAEALDAAMTGMAGVFHLAAVSSVEACSQDRSGTRRINLGGTQAVVRAASARPVVFTSSAAVYGDQSQMPVSETAEPRPISPYAEDKLASEVCLRESGGPALAVRPFNVYGPGQQAASPYSGVISRFVARAQSRQALRINGTGSQTRDFIHVSDVARGLGLAMEHLLQAPKGFEVVNLCGGRAISILDLAQTILEVSRSEMPLIFAETRLGDIQHSRGDAHRASEVLGFRAEVKLSDGLTTLLDQGAPG